MYINVDATRINVYIKSMTNAAQLNLFTNRITNAAYSIRRIAKANECNIQETCFFVSREHPAWWAEQGENAVAIVIAIINEMENN